MKIKWITAFVVLEILVVSGNAQTNFVTVTRTNIIQAAPNFREVNGQLYNSALSRLWSIQKGKILKVEQGGVILQTFTNQPVWEQVYTEPNSQQAIGGYSAGPVGWHDRITGYEEVPLKRIYLENYRIGAVDQKISVPAMKTGTIQIGGNVLEAWDIGLPHLVTNIVSSKIKTP